jgi:hypothetical protein
MGTDAKALKEAGKVRADQAKTKPGHLEIVSLLNSNWKEYPNGVKSVIDMNKKDSLIRQSSNLLQQTNSSILTQFHQSIKPASEAFSNRKIVLKNGVR